MSLSPISIYKERLEDHVPDIGSRRSIALLIILGLVYLNVLPIIAIVISSFMADGIYMFEELTLENYRNLTGQYDVLYNTVLFTLGSATLTTTFGVCIAWVIGRTNAPFRRFFYYAIFFAFFLPPVIWEQTWVRLTARRGVYATIFGVQEIPVGNIPGMVVIQSIRLTAFALILLVPLFASINSSMEESSQMSGAGIIRTARKITIPTVAPGIIIVFIFVTIISLESFRVPLVIGLPNGIEVLSVAIYEAARVEPVDYGLAMTQGVTIILLALPLLYLYRKFVAKAGRFQTVTGGGFRADPVDIGRWRYVASGAVGLWITIAIAIPVVFMIYVSLLPIYIPPHNVDLAMFTLDNYETVFGRSRTWVSIRHSIIAAFVATTLTVFIGTAISWLVQKSDIPLRATIDYLSFLPIAIPSIALALGLAFLYLEIIPIALYGTLTIIMLAFVIRGIPGSVRIIDPAIIQMHDDLLDSAKISGAGRLRRIFTIVIPTIAQTLSALWAFRFSFLMFELSIVMMLYTTDTFMISAYLYTMHSAGDGGAAAALGVLIMFMLVFVTIGVHKVGKFIGGGGTKTLDY